MAPLVVMRSTENYTLPLALRTLQSPTHTEWGALMAGSAIATLAAHRAVHHFLTPTHRGPHGRRRQMTRASPAPADRAWRFPSDFIWGVATSAYQIEGAATEDGKGPSIWDTFCQREGTIADGSSGDVACDHLHRLEADLDLIASLGVNAYRFSMSWPRVQPLGHGAWNERGLAFYERLVDGLLARGIQPHLTLNHWDLPQALQDQGGWASRATVHHFVDYARGVAARLGSRLASICTHNEPWVIATLGHDHGIFAPGIKSRATAAQVSHHLLLSTGWRCAHCATRAARRAWASC